MIDPAGVVVGRATELNFLHAELARAVEGEARLVVIEAEPGMGKTALVRRFVEEIEDGLAVLRVAGVEAEQPLSYGLLNQLGASIEAPESSRITAASRDFSDPWEAGGALLELAADLLDGPLVVVVDDAQWSDADSLRALTFAFRRLGAAAVLGVVCSRPGSGELTEGVSRLAAERGATLRLGGLDGAAVAELSGVLGLEPIGSATAERLVAHTGGHPLHLRALLEELDVDALDAASLPAPRAYSLVVVAQLARLDGPAQALIVAASVLGSGCRLDHAVAVAGSESNATVVDEVVTSGLVEVRRGPVGFTVRFAHPLVEAAVYQSVSPTRQAHLHRAAAGVVDDADRLDHLVAASLGPDDQLAAELAEAAKRDVEESEPLTAARRFRQAGSATSRPAARDGFLLDACEQLLRAGEVRSARATLGELQRRSGLRHDFLTAATKLMSGDSPAAGPLLASVWERARDAGECRLAAEAAEHLSHLHMIAGQADESVWWGHRALEALGDEVPAWSTADAITTTAMALVGPFAPAAAVIDTWGDLDDPTCLRDVSRRLARGMARYMCDRPRDALSDLAATGEASHGVPLRERLTALCHLAEAEFRLGAWDDALTHASVAESLAADAEFDQLTPLCRATLGGLLAARGDTVRAASMLTMPDGRDPVDALSRGTLATSRAMLATVRQDWVGVVTACDDLGAREHRAFGAPGVHRWPMLLATACLRLGRLDEADYLVACFIEIADRLGRRRSAADCHRVHAETLAARGRLEDAREALDTAEALIVGLQAPWDRAEIAESRGRLERGAGDPVAAAFHLRAAASGYRDLQAEPFRRRVEAELADLAAIDEPTTAGASPPAAGPPLTGGASFTPQEIAVASLVASGLTNRETAARLFISVKTVEYHLGHVYDKAGIRGRTALANWWPNQPPVDRGSAPT